MKLYKNNKIENIWKLINKINAKGRDRNGRQVLRDEKEMGGGGCADLVICLFLHVFLFFCSAPNFLNTLSRPAAAAPAVFGEPARRNQ